MSLFDNYEALTGREKPQSILDREEKAAEEEAKKILHVSPFFSMEGYYQFSVSEPAEQIEVNIHYSDHEGSSLYAGFRGLKTSFKTIDILKIAMITPFTTIGVTLDIHWQALLLWCKGLRLYHKPKKREMQYDQK